MRGYLSDGVLGRQRFRRCVIGKGCNAERRDTVIRMIIPCLKSLERSAAASAANCRRRAFSSSERIYKS